MNIVLPKSSYTNNLKQREAPWLSGWGSIPTCDVSTRPTLPIFTLPAVATLILGEKEWENVGKGEGKTSLFMHMCSKENCARNKGLCRESETCTRSSLALFSTWLFLRHHRNVLPSLDLVAMGCGHICPKISFSPHPIGLIYHPSWLIHAESFNLDVYRAVHRDGHDGASHCSTAVASHPRYHEDIPLLRSRTTCDPA